MRVRQSSARLAREPSAGGDALVPSSFRAASANATREATDVVEQVADRVLGTWRRLGELRVVDPLHERGQGAGRGVEVVHRRAPRVRGSTGPTVGTARN